MDVNKKMVSQLGRGIFLKPLERGNKSGRKAGTPHPSFSRACLHRAFPAAVVGVGKVLSRPQGACQLFVARCSLIVVGLCSTAHLFYSHLL